MLSTMIDNDEEHAHAHPDPRTHPKAIWSGAAPETPSTISPSLAPEKDVATSAWAEGAISSTETIPTKKAPVKRIRIPIACVNCRHKKIKCDGQMPCSHCEKFRAECIYPAATKPVNHEYVETLENRLKSVESHLQDLLCLGVGHPGGLGAAGDKIGSAARRDETVPPNMTGSDRLESPHIRLDLDAAFSATSSSRAASIWPPVLSKNQTINYPSTASESHLRSHSSFTAGYSANTLSVANSKDPTVIRDDVSETILSNLLDNLKINHDGSTRFLPKLTSHSEQSFTDTRTFGSSDNTPATRLSTISHISTKLDWESVDLPRAYTLPGNILPAVAIGMLVDIYFKSVHTFLPLLHKPSFMTLCRPETSEYRVPPFLLMAICAIASRHASQSELQALAVQTQVNSKELFQHHVLFDHARALLDTYIDIPRLSTIQGLLLLAYYQIKEKRTGHFFRVRTYISLAVRMSLDMGLARSSFKDIGELDPANSGDDVLNVSSSGHSCSNISPHSSNYQQQHQQNHTGLDASSCTRYSRGNSSCLRKKKATAIQQERRLAWLACFFLDGLSASVLGLDYCVTNVRLEMRKLVREANYTTDTTQGATLIFWYLHLDLVQIYRRICEMYRSLPQSPSSSSSGTNDHDRLVAMTSVRRGTEMLSVEHALNTWLANLPGHLAFTPTSATPSSTTADPSHAPSFYTLYLHRFYYSNMLLLYRPWITFSSSSTIEDLNDPSSAISKCAHAAQMLTEIGEVVFQNYSWPWPGCGLFAYHMLQATEIHLFLVITHQEAKLTGAKGFTDAKAQYLKTMDLIKGYLSLSKLPELDKAITALEQMVINRLAAPKGKVLPETLLSHTAYSVLQQRQHDLLKLHHQKPQLQQGDPQRDSHEYLPSDNDYNPLNVRPVSPVSQTISHLTQQQLYIEQQSQQSFTPKVEDTHMFSPLQPQVVYTAFAEGPSSMAAVPPPAAADLFHPFPLGLDISQHPAESAAEIMQQQQQSPLSSFLYDMDTSSHSLSLYTTGSTQDMFGDPDYPNACPYLQQQQQQEQQQQQLDRVPMASPPHSASHSPAVGDLIGIGIMGPPPPPSLSHTTHPSQAVVTLASSPSTPGYSTLPSIPPPKPPKRVLAQSTGSTNSSSRSQSQKPPVPKKPSRLIDLGGSGGALVSSLSFAQLHQQQPQSLRSRPSTSSLTVSSPSRTAPVSPTPQRRPIKVLQSQSRLYGPVLLKNPQKQEIGSNDHHEEIRGDGSGYDDDVRAEWSFTEAHEYGLEYIKLNPHLQCQVPPRHQPRIL